MKIPPPYGDYHSRVSKAQKLLKKEKLKALLVTKSENVSYLSGLEILSGDGREAAGLLTQKRLLLMLSPLRQFVPAEGTASRLEVVRASNVFRELKKVAKNQRVDSLGFEKEDLRLSEFEKLRKTMAPVTLKPTLGIIESLRLIKEAGEIENISKACRITLQVYRDIRRKLKTGMTEREVAWKIEKLLRECGAQGIPEGFSPVVAFGENSAIPHHLPTERKLAKTDIALLDFGCSVHGYCSDFTRTILFGRPSQRVRQVTKLVKRAHKRALKTITAGRKANQVDDAARSHISQSGFGEHFIHSTGHGLGLSIHEAPSLNPKEGRRLRQGMVITVEPGIYLAGEFGVRHEDTVLVTKSGSQILTR